MLSKINFYLIEYAIGSLLRQKAKNIFILIVFTLLTFLLASVFFITNSIKYELTTTVNSLPQITIQKLKAGKFYEIDTYVVDDIIKIAGIEDAVARVWGYYYFKNAGVNFTVVGIDQYEKQYKNSFEKLSNEIELDENSMIVGSGVKKILEQNYYKDYFNFIKPDGTIKKVKIAGIFKGETQLESNDTIVLDKQTARELFEMDEEKATDIVVKVQNPDEIDTIVQKIQNLYPDTRIITSNDIKVSYQNIFDYKSGFFLSIFIVSLFTFFMVVFDKISGVTSNEKKEIGILKALGWRVDDILKEKFYESFIVSFVAYLLGIIIALFFVYILQAPLLRDMFVGYSQLKTTFELPFILDMQTLFLVFFLTVPIYIAANIIPAWKAATLEADEVIR